MMWREWPLFGLERIEKKSLLIPELRRLTQLHSESCPEYSAILDARGDRTRDVDELESLPFLPVRLFKQLELLSVAKSDVVKTVLSSGSTGQKFSRVYLDSTTAANQSYALVRILQSFFGVQRLPMLIVDHPNALADRNTFSARAAAIMGFQSIGRDPTYLLQNDDNSIDLQALATFLQKYQGKPKLIFGFTSMVWQALVRELPEHGKNFDFSGSLIVHGGGWKKLHEQSVTDAIFKESVEQTTGICRVHNYYGMAEQVGSIFVECEHGRLHVPAYSDVIIRSVQDWKSVGQGELGVVQTLSVLPTSYPGHSLLTEDFGMITGEDDCPCGRLGKTVRIEGRLKQAELRGCSDKSSNMSVA
jgi:hypothetical protein